MLQYLVRELIVDSYASRRGNNNQGANEHRSPTGNSLGNMNFDYLAENEDGGVSMQPLPVTSPSQITINKHNNILNGGNRRQIDLPSAKVS